MNELFLKCCPTSREVGCVYYSAKLSHLSILPTRFPVFTIFLTSFNISDTKNSDPFSSSATYGLQTQSLLRSPPSLKSHLSLSSFSISLSICFQPLGFSNSLFSSVLASQIVGVFSIRGLTPSTLVSISAQSLNLIHHTASFPTSLPHLVTDQFTTWVTSATLAFTRCTHQAIPFSFIMKETPSPQRNVPNGLFHIKYFFIPK
ncbi:uncharacterized protein LOC133821165 isoform X2 [Humulus lupulus]|uniref:uncharacterized protein LOC133821165 isoform X2 n=1 Tax=Humulus lupulus TaxID=3486 RepID=UPI002B409DC4|nr:uncharacterized protein LOC133821165 isoform X2 [Humulus lupulus]